MRRVVITGMGMVAPLGDSVAENWRRLTASESGIGPITLFPLDEDMPNKVAGQVPEGQGPGLLDLDSVLPPKDQRKMARFIHFALAASDEALRDCGWTPSSEEERERIGVMIGSGIGGLDNIYQTSVLLAERGVKKVSPFFIPSCLINLASGQVSIRHQLRGPNHSVVTACATGAHAIGDAARIIALGDAEMMLAGGAEAAICRIGIAGFCALRALSTHFNDAPQKASRPWDEDRDGFVMGEGAGVLVLEELEHARARGARIYAELIGYGMSGDAYHMTAPEENGEGARRALTAALKRARIEPGQVDYINAHGTSTPMGDEIELNAIGKVFGQDARRIPISSTKSAIGHLLGAAGAVESIFGIMSIVTGVVPPTLNLDRPSPVCETFDLVPHKARAHPVQIALSNSFGFGGTNACLIFRKLQD
ncbi:MAG: beta-ketoacyl-ACP synthase II [Alphaproteobacteria bacterium]|nr:MAG: beta-ketoacyl-ACP synthase II [Alphaproteobacteria bacterium]